MNQNVGINKIKVRKTNSFHCVLLYSADESKGYTNLGGITEAIEDPDEEPQIEKPEECVYYNNLSVAKDTPVSDLLNIITTKQAKENEGFLKEFKVNASPPPHTQTRISKKFTTRETLSKASKTDYDTNI